ncbi:MAG: aldo/keto reductase [Phycisphaerales bacterium]|nr:aldo/keto reductase [Phycisphaerales bacterium]
MEPVTIDRTELRVSRLSFGTASIHHLHRSSSRQALLHGAFDAGLTHFDTSPYYAYGLAESELGRFTQSRRSEVTIATKVGLYPPGWTPLGNLGVMARKMAGKVIRRCAAPRVDWTIERARRSLGESLERLRTEYVDLLLLHEPAPSLLDADAFHEWLEWERQSGRLRYWGVAGESAEYRNWLEQDHPITQVTQTHDSMEQGEAAPVLECGRPLQFTYGYLASARARAASQATGDGFDAATTLAQVLARNSSGSILVSTRRVERIQSLAEAVH